LAKLDSLDNSGRDDRAHGRTDLQQSVRVIDYFPFM
jgi:hypothetical protein